jgi:hypothetical protein
MNPAQLTPVVATAGVVLLVVAGVALLLARSARRRWKTELDAARADVEALAARLDAMEPSRLVEESAASPAPAPDFVITSLSDGPAPLRVAASIAGPAGRSSTGAPLTAGEFATVAVGESLVRLLSLGHGVRRALSAENRNRIRFEMRREVKRARRQRRRDLKEAKRHLRHVATGSAEDAA